MLTNANYTSSIPRRTVAIDMLIIASLWCASLFIVNPFGNFPLNDDWSFGLTVKRLIEHGDFRPTGWTSMPLITNVLWGSVFCIRSGFSFTALRLSTLTLSLLGILGGYLLVRDLRQPRWLAITIAFTLGFNPIYYALSNTFMTDVPYTAITILAAIFFARNLRTDSYLDLLIGSTLAIAATLSRQLAISVPLAFAVSSILTRGFRNRNLLRAAIPLALCLGALLVFQQWLTVGGRLPALYDAKTKGLLDTLTDPEVLSLVVNNTYVGLLYLGLFLLPVLIFSLADIMRSNRTQAIVILTLAMGTMVVSTLCGEDYRMPMSGNVLIKSGIGPLTLRDTYVLGLDHVPALPASFWFVITAMSVLGAAFLIATLAVRVINLVGRPRLGAKTSDNEAVGIFFLLSAMIYLLPLLASDFFDRYLVPPIPFFAIGIAGMSDHFPRFSLATTRIPRLAAIALLAGFSLFAIGGTRDYVGWNRVRWEALHDLTEHKHVSAADIDGGFEFNGLYLYDPHYQRDPRKSWWWVQRDTYQIGFQNVPGYTVIKEYTYFHLMPPHTGKIIVLKKNPLRTPNIRGDEHAEQTAPLSLVLYDHDKRR